MNTKNLSPAHEKEVLAPALAVLTISPLLYFSSADFEQVVHASLTSSILDHALNSGVRRFL